MRTLHSQDNAGMGVQYMVSAWIIYPREAFLLAFVILPSWFNFIPPRHGSVAGGDEMAAVGNLF